MNTFRSSGLTDGENTAVLLMVRTHISTHYRPGQRLPLVPGSHRTAAHALASRLGVREHYVSTALRALNSLGEIEISTINGCGPLVLGPNELHRDDVALDAAVRHRLLTGHYRFGQALPTGLLGEEFTLRPEHVARALRRLVADGWLRHDLRGPYGHGYYVTLRMPQSRPHAAAPTPSPLRAGATQLLSVR